MLSQQLHDLQSVVQNMQVTNAGPLPYEEKKEQQIHSPTSQYQKDMSQQWVGYATPPPTYGYNPHIGW